MQVLLQFSKLASLESRLNMQMLEWEDAGWWMECEEERRILCKEEKLLNPELEKYILYRGLSGVDERLRLHWVSSSLLSGGYVG